MRIKVRVENENDWEFTPVYQGNGKWVAGVF